MTENQLLNKGVVLYVIDISSVQLVEPRGVQKTIVLADLILLTTSHTKSGSDILC